MMNSDTMALAFKSALHAVSSSGGELYDKDIPKWSKAALVFLLEAKCKDSGNSTKLPLEIFYPFCGIPRSFMSPTPLLTHLDTMLDKMAERFAIPLTALLDAYSFKFAGVEDKRIVIDVELNHIARNVDIETCKQVSYALDLLCNLIDTRS